MDNMEISNKGVTPGTITIKLDSDIEEIVKKYVDEKFAELQNEMNALAARVAMKADHIDIHSALNDVFANTKAQILQEVCTNTTK
jgi:ribosomal protein L23